MKEQVYNSIFKVESPLHNLFWHVPSYGQKKLQPSQQVFREPKAPLIVYGGRTPYKT